MKFRLAQLEHEIVGEALTDGRKAVFVGRRRDVSVLRNGPSSDG
jgi:hypothetical protein